MFYVAQPRRRSWTCHVISASLAALILLLSSSTAQAQSPSPTPVAPGSGGAVFGSVRVLSGNDLQRNSGQENQPPVWITIDAKGTSAVITVGNATRVPLDFNGTVVISIAQGATALTAAVSTGAAVIQGNQVIWSGFSLAAGQIVPGIVVLSAAGQATTQAGGAIQGVTIDARDTQTGMAVNELAGGGGPTFPSLAAAPAPAAGLVTARAGSQALNPVTPLSSKDGQRYAASMLALLLVVLAVILIAVSLVWRTGRRLQNQLALLGASGSIRPAPLPASETDATRQDADPLHRQPAAWWLEPLDGAAPRRHWPLAAAEIEIGRNPRSDIVVPDPRVSDRHARLIQEADGAYQVIDDGSTNGTAVNGEQITAPVRLKENDVLRFGSTSFVLQHATDQL